MAEEVFNTSENAFESSIESFSHEDVKGDFRKEKMKMLPSLIIRCFLIAVCISLFGYATYMISDSVSSTEEAEQLYENLRSGQLASAVKHSSTLLEPTPMYTFQEMLNSNGEYLNYIGGVNSLDEMERRSDCYRNFLNMYSRYPDTYAWIYVDYTQIDYPVMKGEYTDYYLYKNYKGEDTNEGSITAQSSMSDVYSENVNNVIYGHCMKNGLMFRTLKTFMESANRNTLVKDMNIEIYTAEGLYIYEILSGYRDDTSFFAQSTFESDDEYLAYLAKVDEYNTLRVGPKYDASSQICTLITCSNVSSNEDERYVLHGILKSFIPASQL